MVQYHRLRETFDDTIYSQLPLRRAYHYLFCMDCLCRAEEVVFHDWSWVRCQRCKDVFARKPGVVHVIGEIGGVRGWELHQGILKMSLWEAEDLRARSAGIDALHIVGGQGLDDDWAISAVVGKLKDAGIGHAPASFTHRPPLSSNTLKLLRTLDDSIGVGE